jgi:hypothetical protein
MKDTITLLLYFTCPIAALLFTVRLVCVVFSPKVRAEIQKHPVIHFIWGCYGYFGTLLVMQLARLR